MTRPARPPALPRFDGQIEELEARLLFSADAAAALAPAGLLGIDPDPAPQVMMASAPGAASASTSLGTPSPSLARALHAEMIVVDASVPDADQLLSQLLAGRPAEAVVEVHWLDAHQDGIAQISHWLNGRQDISALHLISHGSEGQIQLGVSCLNQASLPQQASALAGWHDAFTSDADILIYGCDVAASVQGQDLVRQLALLTGADVAASTDLTGAQALGGDWVLEHQTGHVDSHWLLGVAAQASWQHVLPTVSFQAVADTYVNAGAPTTHYSTADELNYRASSGTQTLLKFDLSSLNGATVDSATLEVSLSQSASATGSASVYKMLSSWADTATYNSLVGGVSTNDIEASSSADGSDAFNYTTSFFSQLGDYKLTYSGASLLNTIQSWLNNASSNQGWMISGASAAVGGANIMSSEHSETAKRPVLSITYTVNQAPTLSATGLSASFNEAPGLGTQAAPVNVFSGANVGGLSAGQGITNLTYTVGGLQDGANEVTLVDGTAISLGANTSGTTATNALGYTVNITGSTATVTLSGATGVSEAAMETLVNGIQYQNTRTDTPTAGDRLFTLTQIKDSGGTALGGADTSTLSISATARVTPVNDAPTILSDGGGAGPVSIQVAENLTAVTTVAATDVEGHAISYSISGLDASQFQIDSGTGVLTFIIAPDFENPTDSNLDNIYELTVSASDAASSSQILRVAITDVSSALVVTTTQDIDNSGLGGSYTAEQLNQALGGADGQVSLREAIVAANHSPGADTIGFNLGGASGTWGEHTLYMASALPTLTDTVYLNGTTQAGYNNQPLVVLDGEGGSLYGLNFSSTADGSTVRGLVIRDFLADGIHVQSGADSLTIVGNYIGSFHANGSDAGASERNLGSGIQSAGANLVVGGTTVADRNVIAGNGASNNIYLLGGGNGSIIQGNYIGTDATGLAASSVNGNHGIYLAGSLTNVTIGGTANGAGNVISGNQGSGIQALNTGSITVQGNTIGLDASGTAALGNGGPGIDLRTGAASTIGGASAEARNIIAGNGTYGIRLSSSASHVVQGNHIGVAADGSTLIGNGSDGIYIDTSNQVIGGKGAAQGNVIAGNGGAGIQVSAGLNNFFYRNSLFGNAGLGIDLNNDGVTSNDQGDGDGGANYSNNHPVITSAVSNGVNTKVTGSLEWFAHNTADTVYIEFFASPTLDASGHGEARTYLGHVQATSDPDTGNLSFSVTLPALAEGDYITAVANVETSFPGASELSMGLAVTSAANAPRGKAIWTRNDQFDNHIANWTGSTFTAPGVTGLYLGDDITMMAVAEAPTRDEFIMIGSADVSGKIAAIVWDGSTWTAPLALPLSTPSAAASQYNSFALSYESVSGDAMLVWDNGASDGTGLSYATWDGSTWSPVGTITAPATGEPLHMKLASSPLADEMVLVATTNTGSHNLALVWDGSTWGHAQSLGSNSGKQYFEINAAYESRSGDALVFYDNSASGSSAIQYRVWDGSTWGAEQTLAAPSGIAATSDVYSTVIATDPRSDRIALAVKVAANDVWLGVWDGSNWGHELVATTSGFDQPDHHPSMALAFESQTGDLLVVYGTASGPNVSYRVLPEGGAWSGEMSGPSMGGTDLIYAIKLYADPYTNTIMMGVQDGGLDLNWSAWDGSTWGPVHTLDNATGESYRESFAFAWNLQAPPSLSQIEGDTLAYTEGDGARLIDQGAPATATAGEGQSLAGGTLTVSLVAGTSALEDVLAVRHQGTGSGQIGVNGSNISYEGQLIGSLSGGSLGQALVISLQGAATDAAVGALVSQITYTNTQGDAPSTATRTVRYALVNGQGRSSAHHDATITLTAVNDAPVHTVPGAQTVAQHGTLVFSPGQGNAISVADPDAGTSQVALTLSVLHGQLSLSGSTGLSFSAGDGAADASMSFSGSISDVQQALSGMSYAPSIGYTGPDTLSITTSDQGATGPGAPQTDVDSIAITVNPAVGTSPVITSDGGHASAALSISEHSTAVTTVTATDADVGNTLSYSITGGADAALFSIDAVTGALRFANAPDFESPTDAGRDNVYDLVVQVSDGTNSDTQALAVSVTPVNEAPQATIGQPSYNATEQRLLALHGTGISLSDVDAGTAPVEASLSVSQGSLLVNVGDSGVVANGTGTGTVTLSGSLSQINALLGGVGTGTVHYVINQDTPPATDTLVLQVSDLGHTGSGAALTAADTAQLHITAEDDAPAGSVTVSGTPTQGQTLSATHTLSDADGLGAITYHWWREGVDTGITGSSYLLGSTDIGSRLSVRASYTDGQGTATSVDSAATQVVAPATTITTNPTTGLRGFPPAPPPPAGPNQEPAQASGQNDTSAPPQDDRQADEGPAAAPIPGQAEPISQAEEDEEPLPLLDDGLARRPVTPPLPTRPASSADGLIRWHLHNAAPSTPVMDLLALITPAAPAQPPILLGPLSGTIQSLPQQSDGASATDAPQEPAAVRLMRAAGYASGLGLSIGSVWWTARVSGLLTSALISTPAWRSLDPLPVITAPADDDPHARLDDGDKRLGDREVEHLFDADRPLEQDLPIIQ